MRELFGANLSQIEALADLLLENAQLKGLLGPKELERLWDRHLANSAVLVPFLPEHGVVLDLGSGAGLPGLVLAIMRPDLEFELVDAKQRRTEWLTQASETLKLANVTITWERAATLAGKRAVQAVVSRAVARLDKLAAWSSPLLADEGLFLAIKGQGVLEELAACGRALEAAGLSDARVEKVVPAEGLTPTYVLRATKAANSVRQRGHTLRHV
jgi:16S rRNA (guanine527-N7)-methyltransferase